LDSCGLWDDETFKNDSQAIFGLLAVARQKVTPESIGKLLGLKRPALYTIQHFGSVLHWSATEPVQFLHPSFSDFLCDIKRCKRDDWFISVDLHNASLAKACFQVMQRELCFNICQLATSHISNDEVTDLPSRTATFIPAHLVYSCYFWADHLQATSNQEANFTIMQPYIKGFLHTCFLYWLEVLSLMKAAAIANPSMMSLIEWMKVCDALYALPET
jgi:hypothetical protein